MPVHLHGVLFVSTEADNFICVMPSPIAGARAAVEMRRAIFEYNESLAGGPALTSRFC